MNLKNPIKWLLNSLVFGVALIILSYGQIAQAQNDTLRWAFEMQGGPNFSVLKDNPTGIAPVGEQYYPFEDITTGVLNGTKVDSIGILLGLNVNFNLYKGLHLKTGINWIKYRGGIKTYERRFVGPDPIGNPIYSEYENSYKVVVSMFKIPLDISWLFMRDKKVSPYLGAALHLDIQWYYGMRSNGHGVFDGGSGFRSKMALVGAFNAGAIWSFSDYHYLKIQGEYLTPIKTIKGIRDVYYNDAFVPTIGFGFRF